MQKNQENHAKHIPAEEFSPMFFGDHISFRNYPTKTVALACIKMTGNGASPHTGRVVVATVPMEPVRFACTKVTCGASECPLQRSQHAGKTVACCKSFKVLV